MERIDKIIASQGLYSRSDVKYLVKHKRVAVDGEAVTSSSRKADPEASVITIDGKPLIFKKQVYLMLHKPQGYVSATEDKTQPTVLALVPQAYKGRELFPAGRLDKDTTGLMILTDDGVLAHNILSPRKHVQKVTVWSWIFPLQRKCRRALRQAWHSMMVSARRQSLSFLAKKPPR